MPGNQKPKIAVVGIDSMPGKEIMDVLSKKEFPLREAEFFDPGVTEEYSKLTQFKGEPRVVHSIDQLVLGDFNLVFLASDKEVNKKIGAQAEKQKVFAVDMSGAFWDKEEVPLVVKGINDEVIRKNKKNLIANPHPVTIMLSRLLGEAVNKFGVLKAVSFVLQPVSAFGPSGVEELAGQSADILNKGSSRKKIFKAQIAFNLLSQSEKVDGSGFSSVEKRMLAELRRILKEHKLSLSLVLTPVFHGYSIMTYLELDKQADTPSFEEIYKESSFFEYFSPSLECPVSPALTAGKEKILIGQVKKDAVFPNSFWIWAAADNLTVGSALNAYEIALTMISHRETST